jgi:hypothetical protein
VEFLSPIALFLLFSLALLFFLSRFEVLLREKKEDQSPLLMQQQIDQLRVQLGGDFAKFKDNFWLAGQTPGPCSVELPNYLKTC